MRGAFEQGRARTVPSPCPLPQIACGDSVLSSESAIPQTIWGRGDKSLPCRQNSATKEASVRPTLTRFFCPLLWFHDNGSQRIVNPPTLIPLLLLALIIGCSSDDRDVARTGEKTPDSGSMPKSGATSTDSAERSPLSLIVSGDTRGWIVPCGCTSNQSGGLLRRATIVEQARRNSDVVLLDCGGAADGDAPYQLARFDALLKGEKLMGIDAHNIGAAEAQLGPQEVTRLATETGVVMVSANVRRKDGSSFSPDSVAVERGGLRILITGVCSPSLVESNDVVVTSPADAVLEAMAKAGSGFDRRIVLAWLPPDELRQLAAALPEVDAVIGGPTGQSLPPELVGQVLVTSATNKGKFLSSILIPKTRTEPLSGTILEVTASYEDEPGQQLNLKTFRSMLAERDFTAAESGLADHQSSLAPSLSSIAGSESCRSCHESACSVWSNSAHAHAWDTLLAESAHVDPACQVCHTTGYGLSGGFQSVKISLGRTSVGCENCHGPASLHVANSMERTPFDAAGSCITCHDHENSPHFEYVEYWDKVQHE
jgi:hypothetical protein